MVFSFSRIRELGIRLRVGKLGSLLSFFKFPDALFFEKNSSGRMLLMWIFKLWSALRPVSKFWKNLLEKIIFSRFYEIFIP